MKHRAVWVLAAVAAVGLLLAAWVWWLNLRGEGAAPAASVPATEPASAERGAYLAVAGNCAACHSPRGGAPYAGGRGIDTPFGTVFASNLTPDPGTGIGSWNADDFWRAVHHGRSKSGRLLYPAFPYPNFTLLTRHDSDALFAFLQTLAPVVQPNRAHALRFPYNLQASLAVWRALFFRAGTYEQEPQQSPQWNRGAYLVRGLGHCEACHAPRNLFGATESGLELSGGLIPMQGWYAPSLAAAAEAGVADWPTEQVVALLKTGHSPRGSVMGPMAEVVFRSTQHLRDDDVTAMATFLKALPAPPPPPAVEPAVPDAALMQRGQALFGRHCADCHGKNGEGADGLSRLAGQRSVQMNSHANLLKVILDGGFAPTTAGNPQPFGMPPFRQTLGDAEIAAVASYLRNAWGHTAKVVSEFEVQRAR